ncbi:prepilin-type N-terminal cleavage/methylation domain-containing protein [Pseudokineococcus basanitobsidens]|uniref:Prepilin-type N-terminal cleavage/methylation domain-containing protein n=1 Tax=Pseudokineococcus basanitobsidens TaxID=1926649 RepID=A0ABU8RHY9_9ACTN
MSAGSRGRPRRVRRGEAGFTLVELVVAMSLLSLLAGLVMAVVVGATRETVTATNSADDAADLRRAYTVLDAQVRSAEALNRATAQAGAWYLEMRLAPADAGGASSCAQWRLSADGTLAYRTYPTSGTTGASGWRTVVTELVVPAATATPPLQMQPADAVHGRQRLEVALTAEHGSTRSAQLDVTLVARNTTASTVTNGLTTTTHVCTQGGRP